MPEALSRGTETARLVAGTTIDEEFVHTADGMVTTRFEPYSPCDREGADPDRLLFHMRNLNLPLNGEELPDTRTTRDLALVLASRVTGVNLTPAHHAMTPIVGSADEPN
ncbi:DUF6461 domain-containing protein [Planobispora siamensis]|uniref:Uncharacterized protein n=1 Tax=Planobispora siamensis TaxID=936338 RepID=A0A8J3SED8_9ACTN|nr:DUF6461 domain-containing protein [Planobispora siamensis]GIH91071.1 hypothetical protein Psi01_17010 [Planobispora siamensis]